MKNIGEYIEFLKKHKRKICSIGGPIIGAAIIAGASIVGYKTGINEGKKITTEVYSDSLTQANSREIYLTNSLGTIVDSLNNYSSELLKKIEVCSDSLTQANSRVALLEKKVPSLETSLRQSYTKISSLEQEIEDAKVKKEAYLPKEKKKFLRLKRPKGF